MPQVQGAPGSVPARARLDGGDGDGRAGKAAATSTGTQPGAGSATPVGGQQAGAGAGTGSGAGAGAGAGAGGGAKAGAPVPTPKPPPVKYTGYLKSGGREIAIVKVAGESYAVCEGEELRGMVFREIDPASLTFEFGGATYVLELGGETR